MESNNKLKSVGIKNRTYLEDVAETEDFRSWSYFTRRKIIRKNFCL